jgi:hypothetical protein
MSGVPLSVATVNRRWVGGTIDITRDSAMASIGDHAISLRKSVMLLDCGETDDYQRRPCPEHKL